MTQPSPSVQQPPAPNLTYQATLRHTQPLALPQDTAALPADVRLQVDHFFAKLQSADTAYTRLSEGVQTIWADGQTPADYRRLQVQEHITRTLDALDADLQAAEQHLTSAKDLVRRATTPPALGPADVHELKLLNAREEVRTALEGLPPVEQRRALAEMFEDALRDGQNPAIAYFIGGTDAYKRLLRDPGTRAEFGHDQTAMLRRLLPPSAVPYLSAPPVLEHLAQLLDIARTTRHFTAKDNGWA